MQGNYDLLRQAIRSRPVIAFAKDASAISSACARDEAGRSARPRIPVRRRSATGLPAGGVALHAGSGSDCDTPAQRPLARGNWLRLGSGPRRHRRRRNAFLSRSARCDALCKVLAATSLSAQMLHEPVARRSGGLVEIGDIGVEMPTGERDQPLELQRLS